jgi:hypothetical protein
MMEALIPSQTPSGKKLHRVELRSASEAMMRVANRATVHPTVPSFAQQHQQPGVETIPIRDLSPSETALVWLTASRSPNRSPKVDAFARTAFDVLAHTELAADKQGATPPAPGVRRARPRSPRVSRSAGHGAAA